MNSHLFQLTRTTECGACTNSSCIDQTNCILCSNPDPHMKMQPLGQHSGQASYPSAFDPSWKLVRCANFVLRTAPAVARVVAAVDSPAPEVGAPFQNATSWRRAGYRTIFRHSKIYLFHPTTGSAFVTEVAGGRWMLHTNVKSAPWRNVTTEVRGTSLEAEFRLTAAVCYCDNGVSTCDFCAGRRPVADPLPMPGPVRRPATV